jgi:hypothetical protein
MTVGLRAFGLGVSMSDVCDRLVELILAHDGLDLTIKLGAGISQGGVEDIP